MNIKQFSRCSGLSAHTLRYYEKIGLLVSIGRNGSGHRDFSDRDLDWVQFILRLKETGMPLKDIQRYAELRAMGDSTLQERREILREHADHLTERLQKEADHLSKLEHKIGIYDEMIDAKNYLLT